MKKHLFLAVLLVSLIAMVVIIPQDEPLVSLHQKYSNCLGTSMEKAESGSCLRNLAKETFKDYQASEIETELAKINDSNQAEWCHEFVHYLGWELMENNSFSLAFSKASGACAYGMYHGIVEKYVSLNSEQKLYEELNSGLCSNLSVMESPA